MRGASLVPRTGGVILASNHQSFLDVLILGGACPRPVRYMARRSLWENPVLGWLITDWKAIPVSRDRPGKDELRSILETVRGGEVLALFPEGTRTVDGSIGELRGGIGFLARKAGVPVVPVLIRGAFEAWPRGRRLPRRGRVRIAFGRAVQYSDAWEDREVGGGRPPPRPAPRAAGGAPGGAGGVSLWGGGGFTPTGGCRGWGERSSAAASWPSSTRRSPGRIRNDRVRTTPGPVRPAFPSEGKAPRDRTVRMLPHPPESSCGAPQAPRGGAEARTRAKESR